MYTRLSALQWRTTIPLVRGILITYTKRLDTTLPRCIKHTVVHIVEWIYTDVLNAIMTDTNLLCSKHIHVQVERGKHFQYVVLYEEYT